MDDADATLDQEELMSVVRVFRRSEVLS